ncbi:MAG TPA: regulatory protein RecX [Firmicutes bacterium]|nr:regulatory protein RecX [Bacillota bacterium]
MPDELVEAKQYALNLLSYRSYSVEEFRQRLRQKGFTEAITGQVIALMTDYGYLNDEAYARRWIETLLQRRGYGKKRLLQELLARGIKRCLAETLLEEIPNSAELDRARALAQKKIRSLANSNRPKIYRRLAQFLTRQGFAPEISRRVLEEILPPR